MKKLLQLLLVSLFTLALYFGQANQVFGEIPQRNTPPGWEFNPTGSSHIIAVTTSLVFNCITLADGDYIGVFYTNDSGELACGGALAWNPNLSQVVAAYGDDITTLGVKDGFAENEPLTWKVYYNQTGLEQLVYVTYNAAMPNFNGLYVTNGVSALSSMLNPIGLEVTADPLTTCASDPVQLSANVTGGCGTPIFSWTSDPAGFVSALQNPVVYPTVTTTYFITVSNSFGDSHSSSVVVEVNPLPVFDCPAFGPFCEGDEAVVFEGNGVFSSGGDVVTGFDPVIAGEYFFVYTETNTFGCSASCEFSIVVNPVPVFDCPAYGPFCEGDEAVVFEGAGVYTFNGEVVTGFNPAEAGEYLFVYTETNAFGCEASCEFSVLVKLLPQLNCPANLEVCLNSPDVLLNIISPQGGIYSGEGVQFEDGSYYFEPFTGIGTYMITYCYIDPVTGCENCCEFAINVVASQLIDIPSGWSGISSFITPTDSQLNNLLYPITYPLIILSNFNGVYWPGGNTFTLSNWDEYSGYAIKADWETQLPICGEEVLDKTVNLGQGWSILPVLSSDALAVESLFDGVTGLQIVKDVAGTGVYWP
ncbi:MAG: hypothetical protein IH598_08775, partial [Bacteroidales bacterium]|nr:hypothetical protein [Bacteroidales bacterium]